MRSKQVLKLKINFEFITFTSRQNLALVFSRGEKSIAMQKKASQEVRRKEGDADCWDWLETEVESCGAARSRGTDDNPGIL